MCIFDVYAPCSCPHGRCFTVLAQCFTIASWICSLVAVTSCFYMYVRPIPEEGQPELPRVGFGYFSRQISYMEPPKYQQCVFWDKDDHELYFESDAMWKLGKAMSLLAVVIGTIVLGVVLCTCCVAFQLKTFEGLFWTSMFCFVAQALTFLAWGSDLCDEYECTWSSGTGMNITAAMLWIWAANMIKSFPEALAPAGRGRRKPIYADSYNDDNPNGEVYDDEYDYDGEEGSFGNRDEYYDDDDEYDDDDRDFRTYEDEEGFEDQDYDDDDADHSKYEADETDPLPIHDKRNRRGGDNEMDSSASYFDDSTDDQSRFSRGQDSKALLQPKDDDKESSFRGID